MRVSGSVGAGLPGFVQGVARGMGYQGQVSSKSFVIMGEYDGHVKLYHADLYRLEDPEQVEDLGLGEMTEDGVLVVEWPEQGGWALPGEDVTVNFDVKGESDRVLVLSPGSDRGRAIAAAMQDAG